jgi:hypothetical protein
MNDAFVFCVAMTFLGLVLVFMALVVTCVILGRHKTEYERAVDDEEQLKFLQRHQR